MSNPHQMSNADFRKSLSDRCMQLSLDIIGIYKYLTEEKKEFVLSKQLLRSGTSIGANLAESQNAISKRDFVAKIYISLKECTETKYWLELLFKAQYIEEPEYQTLFSAATEIEKLLTSIEKSTLLNINTPKQQKNSN